MNNLDFYLECARILETDHNGDPFPYGKRTRWNNRKPGQGRFDQYGIIRIFGNSIHLAFHSPQLHRIFESKQQCLEFLLSLKEKP